MKPMATYLFIAALYDNTTFELYYKYRKNFRYYSSLSF